MYSFQTVAGKRKNKQTIRILSVVIFVLVIALAGVTFSYVRISGVSRVTNDALMARGGFYAELYNSQFAQAS